ncbi:MAG: hypothetical protein ACFB0C_00775 [Leptolyngbyaceae cyanobacterium]
MSSSEDWAENINAFLGVTARITESWLTYTAESALTVADAVTEELAEQVTPALDTFADTVEETLKPLEATLGAEADRLADAVAEQLTPVVTPWVDELERWVGAIAEPVNRTVEPWLNDHPACVGCRHYHGQTYGGNLLICAMHPYGAEEPQCPDWESTWPQPPNNG